MYQKHGFWFPDYDTHFAEMLDKNIAKGKEPVYQEPVRKKSFEFVANKGVALDIGANVGLWTSDISKEFRKVIAYEPVADFRKCLQRNVSLENVNIEACALGNENTFIDMIITEENTGHSHVNPESKGSGKIPMYRLDDLELREVDYIKIDCEGYEYNILLGAEQTIKKFKPVIVIEQKFHKDVGIKDEGQAYDLLIGWGMRELARVRNDVILGF
jgi:FkbM family methyltransferase